jgi:hypothetical protein
MEAVEVMMFMKATAVRIVTSDAARLGGLCVNQGTEKRMYKMHDLLWRQRFSYSIYSMQSANTGFCY